MAVLDSWKSTATFRKLMAEVTATTSSSRTLLHQSATLLQLVSWQQTEAAPPSHYNLKKMLEYKTQRTSGRMVNVHEAYTSKTYSGRGLIDEKFGAKMYKCKHCHLVEDRHANAARNVFHKDVGVFALAILHQGVLLALVLGNRSNSLINSLGQMQRRYSDSHGVRERQLDTDFSKVISSLHIGEARQVLCSCARIIMRVWRGLVHSVRTSGCSNFGMSAESRVLDRRLHNLYSIANNDPMQ